MKLKITFIEQDIMISDDIVQSIEVENKKQFYRLVSGIYQLESGEKLEEFQFYSNEGKEINPSIQIISDYFSFEIDSKKTINELYKYIESSIEEEQLRELTKSYQKIYKSLQKILGNIDIPLSIQENLDIESLLKMVKVSIQHQEDILNKLFLLMDVERFLKIHHVVFFVNLKQYLSKDELLEFYKYAIYNKIKIVLLDSQSYGIGLELERKLVVDENLDEFVL